MLLMGLVALIGGLLLRSEGHIATLFIGTVVLATGIATTNVLLPSILKQHYPERVPAITTAYVTVMGAIAALASGVSVPMAESLPGGWRSSLASGALLAAIAFVFWLPGWSRCRSSRTARPAQPPGSPRGCADRPSRPGAVHLVAPADALEPLQVPGCQQHPRRIRPSRRARRSGTEKQVQYVGAQETSGVLHRELLERPWLRHRPHEQRSSGRGAASWQCRPRQPALLSRRRPSVVSRSRPGIDGMTTSNASSARPPWASRSTRKSIISR